MANFSELVRAQRKSGKGVLGSLSAASNQQALQKIDPRNYLFSDKGIMTALFPKLKGYKAKPVGEKLIKAGTPTQVSTEPIISRLDNISNDTAIAAKNFIMLPHMARDMNVFRQNIVKLVKSEGIKPVNRADMFFLRGKERVAAYEAQSSKSPTKVEEEKKQDASWADKVIAGAVIGGLTALFLSPEFRSKMFDLLEQGLGLLGLDMKNIMGGLIATLGGLAVGYLAFKLTAAAVTGLILRSTGGLAGMLGLTTILTALAVGAKQIHNLMNENPEQESVQSGNDGETSDSSQRPAKEKGFLQSAKETMDNNPGKVIGTAVAVEVARRTIQPKLDANTAKKVTDKVGGKAGYNAAAERFTKTDPKTGKQVFAKAKDLPLGTIMEKFRTFAVKASKRGWMTRIISKVAARVGISIALKVGVFLTGLAAAPFTMGLSLLLNIASGVLLAYDIYLLYDMFFGSNNIEDELEKEDGKDNTRPTPEEQKLKKELETPTKVNNPLGEPVKPGTGSPGTFGSLSYEEQEQFLNRQYQQEGSKPGNLAHDLNNPGAMLYSSWQKEFGAIPNNERGTVYSNGKKVPFAQFPTFAQGRMAQRYLWSTKYANKPLDTAVATWSGTKMGTTDHASYFSNVTGQNPSLAPAAPKSSSVPVVTANNMAVKRDNVVSFKEDNRTFNESSTGNKLSGPSANPYDQLFAMLFMDHSSIPQ
jgi:hypothetical protein